MAEALAYFSKCSIQALAGEKPGNPLRGSPEEEALTLELVNFKPEIGSRFSLVERDDERDIATLGGFCIEVASKTLSHPAFDHQPQDAKISLTERQVVFLEGWRVFSRGQDSSSVSLSLADSHALLAKSSSRVDLANFLGPYSRPKR